MNVRLSEDLRQYLVQPYLVTSFEYRMKMACRYLLDSSKTIQEIGACVGYEYHAHFSTAFKRKFGLTPLEYRCSRLSGS